MPTISKGIKIVKQKFIPSFIGGHTTYSLIEPSSLVKYRIFIILPTSIFPIEAYGRILAYIFSSGLKISFDVGIALNSTKL